MAKYPGSKFRIEHGNADEFGKYYLGSNKQKQNDRRRKLLERSSKRR